MTDEITIENPLPGLKSKRAIQSQRHHHSLKDLGYLHINHFVHKKRRDEIDRLAKYYGVRKRYLLDKLIQYGLFTVETMKLLENNKRFLEKIKAMQLEEKNRPLRYK